MKKIDEIVTISDERKKILLRAIDNYARFPGGADIVAGLEQIRKDTLIHSEDELVFVAFMIGSISGTDKTITMMQTLNHAPEVLSTMSDSQLEGFIKKIQNQMDDALK